MELAAAFTRLRGSADLRHKAKARHSEPPTYLLRAYAAECGLKAKLLRAKFRRPANTLEYGSAFGTDGHNLKLGLEELQRTLNAPAGSPLARLIASAPSDIRLQKTSKFVRSKNNCASEQVHQCWRYGIPIAPQDEKLLASWHEQIIAWLKQEGLK